MIVSKVSQPTPSGFVAVPEYAGRFIADVADIISARGPRSAVTSHAGAINNAHESHNDGAARKIGRGSQQCLFPFIAIAGQEKVRYGCTVISCGAELELPAFLRESLPEKYPTGTKPIAELKIVHHATLVCPWREG